VDDRRLSVRLRQTEPIPLDVEFTCGPDDVVAIFGPSGSGKTTILRSIAGLFHARDAEVRVGPETWTDTGASLFRPPHRRAAGFVFQDAALFPHLTARENVLTALSNRPRGEREPRVKSLVARMHLSSHADRRPHELSGGERQRVALARALAREPAVLLLDEPFAALDRALRRQLQDEVRTLRQTLGMPLVLVTHDFDDVVRLATHVLLLDRGRQVAWGTVAALMARPDLTWLREAVGLGSVFDGVVSAVYPDRRLAEVTFRGGALLVSDRVGPPGSVVRFRIPAREVILSTRVPEGLSLHNVLTGVVSAVHPDPTFDHVMVQLVVGQTHVLAEVTEDAVARLGIVEGAPMHALVKTVSVEI